ncbi:MAG: Rieske 2Fe-2S domain-containing protein [Ignavibacterium sp.]|jgi:Rieske Fe-S protein
MNRLDRRRFLRQTGLAAGSLALGGIHFACATMGAPMKQVELQGSTITFDTAIPELQNAGDAVALDSMFLEYPILLIREENGSFVALSSGCTHLGCTVRKEPALLRCPCHDSAFTLKGEVLNGPAEKPLREYAVRMKGNTAEIEVNL